MDNPQSTVVWVDIPCRDLDRAITFYEAMLGRKVHKEAEPRMGILPHTNETVGGCLVEGEPSDKGPMIYINVGARLIEATASVTAHGGKVLEEAHPIGPHGSRSVVLDSEGNRIALHSPP